MGVKVRFLDIFNLKYKKLADIVGISGKSTYVHKNLYTVLNKLKKRKKYLIWFDQGDSPRCPNPRVIKFVDRYYKRQLLKDRSLYRKTFYKNRYHFDYYAKNYVFANDNILEGKNTLDPQYEDKIGISWNWALSDYRYKSNFSGYFYNFIKKQRLNFFKPSLDRKYTLSANYFLTRSKTVVYFQREKLLELLLRNFQNNPNFRLGRISKKEYLKTQRESKAILSPFGWGEICLRDFETFIAGAALIKPNMDHLETWPDIFIKNKTYFSIPWKVEEWEDAIIEILSDEKQLLKIAEQGQYAYKKIWSKEGKELFCKKFIEMISPS